VCGCGGDGLRAGETEIAGRVALSDGVGAGVAAGEDGCAAGVAAAGASPAGAGGGVWDQAALTHTDEIRKDVDASQRGRNPIDAPCPEGRPAPDRAGCATAISAPLRRWRCSGPNPATAPAHPGSIRRRPEAYRRRYDVVNQSAYPGDNGLHRSRAKRPLKITVTGSVEALGRPVRAARAGAEPDCAGPAHRALIEPRKAMAG